MLAGSKKRFGIRAEQERIWREAFGVTGGKLGPLDLGGRRGHLGLKEDLRESRGGAFEFCPQKRGTRGGPSAQECSGVNNGGLGGQQGGRGVWGRTRGSIALSHTGCHTRVPNASSLLSPPNFGDHALSPLCFPPPSPLGDSSRELCGHSDPQMAFVTC